MRVVQVTLFTVLFFLYNLNLFSQDECTAAIALTVNPNQSCGTTIAGNTSGATQSQVGCLGTANDDIWYSFVATSTVHYVDILNASNDMMHQVFSGSCGSLIGLTCSDPNASTTTGLIIGNTYYVRVYGYYSGSSATFDICIGTPPPPPANDECTGAIALTVNADLLCGVTTSGYTQNATNSGISTCSGTADEDVWYSFVAAGTTHEISLSNMTGTSDMIIETFSGSCGALTSISCANSSSISPSSLIIGNTYYVRVYSYSSSTQNTGFDICVGTLPTGSSCSDPHVLGSLPYNNTGMNTNGFSDMYNSSDACGSNYMNGDDYVFEYTPGACENITIALSNADSYAGVFLLNGCPDVGATYCVASATGSTATISAQEIFLGNTYYIIVSTYPSPQATAFDIDITTSIVTCPTCSDGIMNGDETGIDCGGSFCSGCPGTTCASPVTITSLPYSDLGISTAGMGDDYTSTDACGSFYMDGDDYVLKYTATTADTCVTLSLENASTSFAGLFILDGCPDAGGTACIASDVYSSSLSISPVLVAGTTYYIVMSTFPAPQTMTFDFTMTNTCPPPCGVNPVADDACASATYISNLDGFCGNTSATYTYGDAPGSFCGSIENNSWLTFTADSTTAIINAFVSNCTVGDGIQIEIYETSDCVSFTSVSNCWNPWTETDGTITATGLTVGNDYYIMIDGNGGDVCDYTIGASFGVAVLPVSLSSFTANCYNSNVQLEWSTLTEINNDYFLVEKTFDGENYKVVGQVKGNGNSNGLINYQWIDTDPSASEAYYRLKQVDFNGDYVYTGMIKSKCMTKTKKTELKIYPNPFKDQLTIELNDNRITEIEVEIMSQFGENMYKETISVENKKAKFKLKESIPVGLYFIKATINQKIIIEKLVKR